MPSLYHFNSDQFKENLMLGGQQHMVAGRLCQYLKGWQLDGIRFLYKHFEKNEACILNDESGLGKVVTVAVFLGAILNNDTTKKCLIIVSDDEHIEGWRFHLSVLTQLTVKVIERTSDINYETVFLIKWSTLKNIGQITKVTFDHIIIDNRGEMLTNKFCTGILLRYYENKTSIVISSADVTADIKLLHILLRLCGRLDKQYTDVKTFEEKFQLPKLKDGVCSKVDLEDYFLKREKVITFCREFRLRRYCHQFDEEFPLVPSNEFKKHLQQWRSSENSQSSGSVKLLSSSSEKDIEELFQAYFQVKEERHANKLDCEVRQITGHMNMNEDDDLDESDEVVIMSPLLFVSESESDGEEIQVQIEASNTFSEEVKGEEEEEDEQDVVSLTKEKERSPSVVNRRKSTKPVKKLTQDLVIKKALRSRKVPNSESPSREPKKSIKLAQKTTDNDVHTPKKRGRKPKLKVLEDKETNKRLNDDEFNRNKNREAQKQKDETGKVKKNVENRISKKDLAEPNEEQDRTKDEGTNKVGKLIEDKTKYKEKDEMSKKSQTKLKEFKKKSNEDDKKKLDKSKKKSIEEGSVIVKKTPVELERNKKQANEEVKEKEKKKQCDLNDVKKRYREVEEVVAKKKPSKVDEDRQRANEEGKEKEKKKRSTEEVVIGKKSKLEENRKRASVEEKSKETKNQEKKRSADGEEKVLLKKTKSKPDEEKETPDEGEKQKKKQPKLQEEIPEKKRPDDVQDKSKEAKEEENKRRRAKDNGAKDQNDSKKVEKDKPTRQYRSSHLNLMLDEANKFVNNKRTVKRTVSENTGLTRKTRSPDIPKTSTAAAKSITSPNRCLSRAKTPTLVRKPLDDSVASPKSSSKPKDKRTAKPLTVYAPLGVHSRSTRGMERCTRSCPIQNKYMKVAIAQVDIDKANAMGKIKRVAQRHSAAPPPKVRPSVVETKLPPSVPPISESPAALESMQLGQALTPTTGLLVPDFIAPLPKNVDYNFPLMLDKDIPDTECIITSQLSNNNEIIILTGSSSTDNEMEPPKTIISRRKATIKPPMVTIPRPSYNKAKSPDLFSTCSDVSLPCSQQPKSHFEGFKIFGSELRQSSKQRSCLDILERIPNPRATIVAAKKITPPKEKPAAPQQHCIEDEDAMFEITSNGTFGNIVRVNSKGEISPVRNKNQSTPPPSVSHPKNRITNYLISNNQHANGAAPLTSSLEDTNNSDPLPKTPKRRKSLSGTVKRSPRALSGGITGGKSQSTKLTQWLVKNAVVRISETTQKPLATKRRRLDLSFPDD